MRLKFASVAEDIEWLRDDWWLGASELLHDSFLERGSLSIANLLVDGLLVRAWRHYGFSGEPQIDGPDIEALAMAHKVQLKHAAAVIGGGGREHDTEIAFLGVFRVDNPKTGVRADAESGFAVLQTGVPRDARSLPTPGPLDDLVHRFWPVSEYLASPCAVRRGLVFSRREIVEHVRGIVTGLEISTQDALDASAPPDAEARHSALEELETSLHSSQRGGLGFELLSIGQAIGRSPDCGRLAAKIHEASQRKRQSQPVKRRFEQPNQADRLKFFMAFDEPAETENPDAPLLPNVVRMSSLEVPLYRTFRWTHLIESIRKRTLALVAPRLWDDPFESLMSRIELVDEQDQSLPTQHIDAIRSQLRAQCWSLVSESDGLWRTYSTIVKSTTMSSCSHELEGARVRTSNGRLLRALWGSTTANPERRCFVGAVQYMPEREALTHAANAVIQAVMDPESHGRPLAESLLVKRLPFSSEREVRLILLADPLAAESGAVHFVSIDPNELYRDICLDPRLHPRDVEDRVAELRELGYSRAINQSALYRRTGLNIAVAGDVLEALRRGPLH